MTRVLVCKNDGCFEFRSAELQRLECWSDVKMELARTLYCEEELFAVATAEDIALYAFTDGASASENATDADVETRMVSDSRWVLDIFNAPFRRSSDLKLQTDHAIRGVRRSSAAPLQTMDARRSSVFSGVASPPASNSSSTVPSPLGNIVSASYTDEADGYREPYIHIGTWVPLMVKDRRPSPLPVMQPLATQYEDVLLTTSRARDYISQFRRAGRPVTILSIQTCLLPLSAASPSAISQHGPHVLYEGVYNLSAQEVQRGFVQAVRLWFSFDCEQTISVTKANGALGLKPLRQQDGWIVVQALPGSPCFEAGMRNDEVFLTHVNGVDVSPHAFPAIGEASDLEAQHRPQLRRQATWQDSVVPLVEKNETCIFTFF